MITFGAQKYYKIINMIDLSLSRLHDLERRKVNVEVFNAIGIQHLSKRDIAISIILIRTALFFIGFLDQQVKIILKISTDLFYVRLNILLNERIFLELNSVSDVLQEFEEIEDYVRIKNILLEYLMYKEVS